MLAYSITAWIVDILIAIGLVLLVYATLRRHLRAVLDQTVAIPEASIFYERVLAIVLVFLALKQVVGGVRVQEGAFMEYVWAVAGDLSKVFESTYIVLLVYAGLVTVLVAALRPKHVQ